MSSARAPAPEGGVRAHRLSEASSAYLRSAAEQAIDWHPWGTEPFELAKRQNRPVLLDIGAVWCHWCHVMDETTYADSEVARLLRQHFIAVKVDRDQHPEVDRRYQRQVSALSGQGGWPLTAFLTPEGEAFLGGTFFPPEDAMGRPGFRRVLREVARIWREEPEKARGNVRAIGEAFDRMEGRRATAAPASAVAFVARSLEEMSQSYDPVNGGFGMAPKFPHPTAVSFLLYQGFAGPDPQATARARETLVRMADGGMYDQLGGGFHRYSVDEGWHIPHFEKMGADNAALLHTYVEGARRLGEARLDETIRGILGWVETTLVDPAGGFGASQDADNAPGDDGSYFTWSRAELKAALDPEELKLVSRVFGVGSDGRMPHDPDRNVLFRLLPLSEVAEGLGLAPEVAARSLQTALDTLRSVRARRSAPFVDRALYADLNGGFIRGFAAAGTYLGEGRAIALARAAADRFLADAVRPDQGVGHVLGPDGASGFGHLEDNAMFALGLLELAAATAEPRYLASASTILELIDRRFSSASGLLSDLAPTLYDGPPIAALATPTYPLEDNPHLSANAAVALANLRLSALTGQDVGRDRARALVSAMLPRVEGAGVFAAGSALAAGLLSVPAARIVVEGSGAEAAALLRAAQRSYHPNLAVFAGTPAPPFTLPDELQAGPTGRARALVCFGTRCLAPVNDPSTIATVLAAEGRPSP